MPFGKYLKDFDVNLYQQYALESFKDKKVKPVRNATKTRTLDEDLAKVDMSKVRQELSKDEAEEFNATFYKGLIPVTELDIGHPALDYVKNRKIPEVFWNKFFYAKKFVTWAKSNTDRFDEYKGKDHPRLVIPWYNTDGKVFAYQARAFGHEEPKYYSLVLDDKEPHFFGLERVDFQKKITVVEGPIDSLFVNNGIAVGSSGLLAFDRPELDVTYCYDAESRNSEIMKAVSKAITLGKNVVIWPESFHYKDINEAVEAGLTINEVNDIISRNTYSGLAAKMKYIMYNKTSSGVH
jgi:hypothetical protein